MNKIISDYSGYISPSCKFYEFATRRTILSASVPGSSINNWTEDDSDELGC